MIYAQQPKPYALTRWRMPPAQLIGQRLRARLGARRAIVPPGQFLPDRAGQADSTTALAAPPTRLSLQLELEEFSQLFASPSQSSALVRLHATLLQRSATGKTLLAQRSFVAQQAAPTPDASGGVQALSVATDQVLDEIDTWLGKARH